MRRDTSGRAGREPGGGTPDRRDTAPPGGRWHTCGPGTSRTGPRRSGARRSPSRRRHRGATRGLEGPEAYGMTVRAHPHRVRSRRSLPGARSVVAGSAVTGPSLTRRPRKVVQAPGAGVQARTTRSTRSAGARQSTRASSAVSLGASDTPSAGWGTASTVPASSPSSVASSRAAPRRPAGQQLTTGVVGADHLGEGAEDGAGVQALLQPERGGPCHLVAGHDRVLDGRGPPPGRQQGEVQVDPPQTGGPPAPRVGSVRRRRRSARSPGRARRAWRETPGPWGAAG